MITQDIQDWLDNDDNDLRSELFHGDLYLDSANVPAGWTLKLEERHGGEGEGDQYYAVWSFTKGDTQFFIKFDGWYASHYGSEFNELFEVKPKEVVRTEYTKV